MRGAPNRTVTSSRNPPRAESPPVNMSPFHKSALPTYGRAKAVERASAATGQLVLAPDRCAAAYEGLSVIVKVCVATVQFWTDTVALCV